ncbi:alginate export family protein [Marinicella sp. W31]|uniref:alginate export family protein n=1 Tax=Marinicella sp. W31 TaxID=3023713 RepID=UPI0037574845
MKNKCIKSLALITAGMTCTTGHSAETFAEAFSNGKASLSFRYRYEYVDQDIFDRDANASTVRTRLNFKTEEYNGLTFFIEADNVTEVFSDNYNAGAGNTPTRGEFPVVADPTGTEINQAWFNWGFGEHGVKIGRQRIVLDNQRFIGGVAWRQNEQTFDAASLDLNFANSRLFLSYVDDVNRIFGDDVPAGHHDSETLIANWAFTLQEKHKFVAYYYDIDNEDVAAFSTSTLGASYKTHWMLGEQKMNFGLEFATQSDAANNPVDYDADYLRLDAGLDFNQFNLFAGYEVLEGDTNRGGAAFRTPLATLHAFNGWADLFLATPGTGIEDTFIGIKSRNGGRFNWRIVYHQFDAESGSLNYGNELDASISTKISKHMSLLLKAAQYDADEFGTDTTKFWVMLTTKF